MASEPGVGGIGSMAQAVSKMDDMFRSTDTELGNLERKLEVECANLFDEDNLLKEELRNPVKVMKRLNEVKSDFAKIKQEVADIQKLQLDALTEVKTEFDKMLSALSSLENKVLQPGEVDEEAYQKEQQLLSLIDHMSEKTANKAAAKTSSTSSTSSAS